MPDKQQSVEKPEAARALTPAQQLRRTHGHRSVADAIPWMLASLAFHLVILAIMLMMSFGGVVVVREEIRIDTDLIDLFAREDQMPRSLVVDPTQALTDEERQAQLMESLRAGAGPEVIDDMLEMESVNLAALGLDLETGGGPRSLRPGDADLTGRVTGAGREYRDTLDELARQIIDTVERHRLLVVIQFDMSRSLEPDRNLFGSQLGRTFQDVRLSITEEQEARLQWAVVGFGRDAAIRLRPTRDISAVQAAINDLPFDASGYENTVGGLAFTVRQLGNVADRTFVVLISDEHGHDTGAFRGMDTGPWVVHPDSGNINTMDEAVRAMRQAQTRLFVFGRETRFNQRAVEVRVDWAERPGIMELGYPSRRSEVAPQIWMFRIGEAHNLPSGFGPYSLSALALGTGGGFYIIGNEPPRYDPSVMEPYRPEIIPPAEYDRRVAAAPLRSAVIKIRDQFNENLPPSHQSFQNTWREQVNHWENNILRQLENKIKWCDESIDELIRLRGEREREPSRRWRANYDLLFAHLHKLRFMLAQYGLHTRELMAPGRFPRQAGQQHVRFELRFIRPDDPNRRDVMSRPDRGFLNWSRERAWYDRTMRAFDVVIQDHAGTPWADMARNEKETMWPLHPYIYLSPPTSVDQPPRPLL